MAGIPGRERSTLFSRLRRTLGDRRIWLRHNAFFHFAHHPLCGRFHKDVLHLGKLNVCRSCTGLFAGLAGGLLVGCLITPLSRPWPTAFAAVLVATLLAILSQAQIHSRLPRLARDVTRTGIGFLPALALTALWPSPASILPIVLLALARPTLARQRARRKSDACSDCTELSNSGICSGYTQQALGIRNYELEFEDLLLRQLEEKQKL